MAGKRIRIVLEVEALDASLAGQAQTPDGAVREFSGWLGLLGTLQELLPDAVPSDDEDMR